jgi:integrase
LRWSRERFVQVATAWLKFMDRLEIAEPKHVPGERWIKPFVEYSLDERGLSIHSVRFDSHHLGKFFEWLAAQNRTLARCRLKDVDAFVESLKQKGWCRVSIARSVEALRAFFRYAERSGWCTTGIAAGIERPRLYRDEGLPVGPDWSDVECLIRHCNRGPRLQDIRDKAILELLAIYGLRWRGHAASPGRPQLESGSAASQIAAASAASVLLFLRNGRTNLVAISRTSWPIAVNRRAQCCELPQASMATIDGQITEVLKYLRALQLGSLHLSRLRIDRVQLEEPLRNIETDYRGHHYLPKNVANA